MLILYSNYKVEELLQLSARWATRHSWSEIWHNGFLCFFSLYEAFSVDALYFPNQVGSFFMINLCLVVIATQFSETKQRENALMREQRARYMSNDSTLASYSEPGSCYEEMLRYISHLYRKLTRRLQRMYYGWHRYRECQLNIPTSQFLL